MRTLAHAIALASACSPGPCAVLVAAGRYAAAATIELAAGVDLYGGYADGTGADPAWARTLDASAVVLTASASPVVHAEALDAPTVLDRLTIAAPDATTPSTASVAVIVGATPAVGELTLSSCIVSGGFGAPGLSGAPPDASACDVPGGAGGTAFDCGAGPGGNGSAPGDPTGGGSGGVAGTSACDGTCPAAGAGDGAPGADGSPGSSPRMGGVHGGSDRGTFMGEAWVPTPSDTEGDPGGTGRGGGGGGAGGSLVPCPGCAAVLGGAGGAGGAGGCGGVGGHSAVQGGASFGVVLVDARLTVFDTTFQIGQGGDGGAGGRGGDGGAGLAGSPGVVGGAACCGGPPCGAVSAGSGGAGGAGGAGDGGSGGAGGNGGPAAGIVLVGVAGLDGVPALEGGAGGAGGIGGTGGRAAGGTGFLSPPGDMGVPGAFGGMLTY